MFRRANTDSALIATRAFGGSHHHRVARHRSSATLKRENDALRQQLEHQWRQIFLLTESNTTLRAELAAAQTQLDTTVGNALEKIDKYQKRARDAVQHSRTLRKQLRECEQDTEALVSPRSLVLHKITPTRRLKRHRVLHVQQSPLDGSEAHLYEPAATTDNVRDAFDGC